jgi:hypothetical protein
LHSPVTIATHLGDPTLIAMMPRELSVLSFALSQSFAELLRIDVPCLASTIVFQAIQIHA